MRQNSRLPEGWTTLFLLWAMLLVASIAILQTELIEGLHIIPIAATVGMFAGFALAKSHFKDRTTYVYAIIFGVFTIIYLIGTILPGDLIWRDRVFQILTRQGDWLEKAFSGGTSRDGLIFVIQTAAVYWLLGYTAAWYTFRYPRLWRVIIPTGLVLMSVVYYYNGPKPLLGYLALYAILALVFSARTHLYKQEIEWRKATVFYEDGIWYDFLRSSFIIATLILFLSWGLPSLSANSTVSDALSGTQHPWREFQDNWVRLFSSLRAFSGETADPYQDNLILGGPRTPGSTLIMDVVVPEELPNVYWQGIVYDTYENGGWQIASNADTRLHYPDDGNLEVPLSAGRVSVQQLVVNYLPNSSYLYSAPHVISTDRQMFVESTMTDSERELVTSLRSRYILEQGARYKVVSRMSTADADALRGAGIKYPDWVIDRYLQVPEEITPETLALAEELTSEWGTPFDKSIAVRDYLRTNLTYNDQIPAPPDNVEPIHHTLFETQEAYCNYYASAMAIMLRSQGVPTRVVSGFAQGDFEEESRSYRVRASNAHTWVEVYFPNFGWIQFEPTVSIPTVDRPDPSGGGDAFAPLAQREDPFLLDDLLAEEFEELREDDNVGDPFDASQENIPFWERVPIWQMVATVVILLIAAIFIFAANEMNKRIERNVDRSYHRLGAWSRWFNIKYKAADTPYERADIMSSTIPEGQESIHSLTRQYVKKRFSAEHEMDETFDSRKEWKTLRPLLLRQFFSDRFLGWRNRK